MKFTSIIIFLLFSCTLPAQNIDSTNYKWNPSLISGFKFSQISFSNWTKGGENSLTWTILGDFCLNYNTEIGAFKTRIKAEYGRAKTGSNEFRINENELYIDQVLSYNAGWKVDPYVSNSIRTQLTHGYDYSKTPAKIIAGFFDPGYITQSLGFTFDRNEIIQTRLGLAFQETFANKYRTYTDLKTTPRVKEAFKFETGFESVTNAKVNFENLVAESSLHLFTRFEHIDVVDIRWDNRLIAKVNNWFNVSFTYNFVFKKSESLSSQMKEAMQMGVIYAIL